MTGIAFLAVVAVTFFYVVIDKGHPEELWPLPIFVVMAFLSDVSSAVLSAAATYKESKENKDGTNTRGHGGSPSAGYSG